MDDPKFDSKFFFEFLWNVLTVMFIEHAEREALVDALAAAGVLPRERYAQLRDQKRQESLDTIRRAAESGENPWLALLKAFEGPVQ